jgi:DNA-nicking Smr family endonuclease
MPKPPHPRFSPSDDLLDARPVATLDLHGQSVAQATAAVQTFLQSWQRRAPGGVVHVITGKGRRSATGPALRPAVARFLKSSATTLVRDWTRDTDEGGFLVRLG